MRRYDEQVEVRRGLVSGVEGPHQILWRGRLYLVRHLLAQWRESGPWWRSPAARAVHGAEPVRDPPGADDPARPAGSPPVLLLEDVDREVWRVEAAAGRMGRLVVLDLALDVGENRWWLVHVHD